MSGELILPNELVGSDEFLTPDVLLTEAALQGEIGYCPYHAAVNLRLSPVIGTVRYENGDVDIVLHFHRKDGDDSQEG